MVSAILNLTSKNSFPVLFFVENTYATKASKNIGSKISFSSFSSFLDICTGFTLPANIQIQIMWLADMEILDNIPKSNE